MKDDELQETKHLAAGGTEEAAMPNTIVEEVVDNPEMSRYEIRVDGRVAGFAQYRLHHDRITFFHTEVDPAFAGRGLGGQLARSALDGARSQGKVVVPLCPFIASYIRTHPEHLDLVVPAMREKVKADGRGRDAE